MNLRLLCLWFVAVASISWAGPDPVKVVRDALVTGTDTVSSTNLVGSLSSLDSWQHVSATIDDYGNLQVTTTDTSKLYRGGTRLPNEVTTENWMFPLAKFSRVFVETVPGSVVYNMRIAGYSRLNFVLPSGETYQARLLLPGASPVPTEQLLKALNNLIKRAKE